MTIAELHAQAFCPIRPPNGKANIAVLTDFSI